VRGNTRDRAARRRYLLTTYESDVPGHCRCYRCGVLLCEVNVTVDRIVPGAKGGKYVRSNCRPACGRCNSATAHKAKV
jgi:5-methylcytosine-specific restriction endonuclease McrA